MTETEGRLMAGENFAEARRLAGKAVDADYGEEAYRLRLASASQTYALLAVVEAIEDMSRALVENLARP